MRWPNLKRNMSWAPDPAVILADMAELTHWLTRLKFVPAAQEDIAFSAQLRTRGVAAAEKLSTRILSRVWQVLLAGNDEVARAGQCPCGGRNGADKAGAFG
jgi:DNA polymerase-3 subunit gamma/tau